MNGGRVFAALQWTSASSLLRALLQFAQLTILARLLEPDEFGRAAAVIAIIAVGSVISDLGLNSAYVYARDVDERERSALYWVNVLAGGSMTILVLLISPMVTLISQDQQLPALLSVYSPIFLITSIGLQLRFDAEKRLAFKKIAIVEILSAALAVFCSIGFALSDAGAIAIIYGALFGACAGTIFNWLLLSEGWRPILFVPLTKARRFVGYGFATVGNGLMNQFSTSLDMMLGARLLGLVEFGLYAAPRNLFNQALGFVNPIVTRIGFPLVAELNNDRSKIADLYRRILGAIVAINAPFYLFMAAFSDSLVKILFGEHWQGQGNIFSALALWGLSRSIMNPLGNLIFGSGRPDLALKWNIGQTLIALLVLWHAHIADAKHLAYAVFILIAGQIVPSWYFIIRRLCNLTASSFLKTIWSPIAYSIVALIPVKFMSASFGDSWQNIVSSAVSMGVIYTYVSWLRRQEWILIIYGIVNSFIGSRDNLKR